ncbi:MAG: MmRce1 family CPBP family CAAX prenyl protease [Desulfosarcinaceae bacterium]|nr:MmRce1 family CPBP family CAAX prenyl protease [Desulfosarcinaceae bacterium]
MISTHRYKPGLYFTLTFFSTYLLWFAGAYLSFHDRLSDFYMLLMLPGLMAPFLISLVMMKASGNEALKKDHIDRLFNPRRIRLKMLPAFVLIMPLSVLVSILISLLFGESTAQFQLAEGFSFSSGFVPVLLLLLLAATFEEIGWRGYAFDSLQSRYSYLTASIIFSLLWSLWHFPLVFVKDAYQYEIMQQNIWFGVNFFVSIIPMGVIISWICIKNRKSVLAAIGFHFIINISQELLEISQTTKCIQTFVLMGVAATIVLMERERFFSSEASPSKGAGIHYVEAMSL